MATRKRYRVGQSDVYEFEFQGRSDGTITIVATALPPNRRGGGVSESHVFSNGMVCVSRGSEPKSMSKAIAIAKHFATGYSHYQRTGHFPNGKVRVNT